MVEKKTTHFPSCSIFLFLKCILFLVYTLTRINRNTINPTHRKLWKIRLTWTPKHFFCRKQKRLSSTGIWEEWKPTEELLKNSAFTPNWRSITKVRMEENWHFFPLYQNKLNKKTHRKRRRRWTNWQYQPVKYSC